MPARFSRVLSAALIALILASVFLTACGKKKHQPGQFPEIALKTYAGKPYTLSPSDTQVTLLVFWATWCGPCLMEIPDLVEFQKRYGPRGFRVVSINTDDPDGSLAVPIGEQRGVNYPVLIGTDAAAKAFGGLEALPTSFLIGRDGTIKQKLVGLYPSQMVESLIREQL